MVAAAVAAAQVQRAAYGALPDVRLESESATSAQLLTLDFTAPLHVAGNWLRLLNFNFA